MSANVAIDKIEMHPGSSNKLRVTFSEAVTTATAENIANYSFSPSLTVQWAAMVSGSSNTQVDLHFGTAPSVDANTVALWLNNEANDATMTDSGANAYNLTGTLKAGDHGMFYVDNGLLNRSKRTKDVAFTETYQMLGTNLDAHFTGDFTVQFLLAMAPTIRNVTTSPLFDYGTNFRVVLNSLVAAQYGALYDFDGYIRIRYVGSATYDVDFGLFSESQFSKPWILTVRKRTSAAGFYVVDVFYNKVLLGSSRELTGNVATGSPTFNFQILGSAGNRAIEYLDFVNWRNEVMTDTAIAAVVDNALHPIAPNTYTLTVSNIAALSGGELIVAPKDTAKVQTGAPSGINAAVGVAGYVERGVSEPTLTFIPAKLNDTTVRLSFSRPMRGLSSTTVTSNYTISGPTALTVSGVSFSAGNAYVDLTVSGVWAYGTYNVTLASRTVQAQMDLAYNETQPRTLQNREDVVLNNLNPGIN